MNGSFARDHVMGVSVTQTTTAGQPGQITRKKALPKTRRAKGPPGHNFHLVEATKAAAAAAAVKAPAARGAITLTLMNRDATLWDSQTVAVVLMDPNDFLKLAAALVYETDIAGPRKFAAAMGEVIKGATGAEESQGALMKDYREENSLGAGEGSFWQDLVPYLEINETDVGWQVSCHEGRHRAAAAVQMGLKAMPVTFILEHTQPEIDDSLLNGLTLVDENGEYSYIIRRST